MGDQGPADVSAACVRSAGQCVLRRECVDKASHTGVLSAGRVPTESAGPQAFLQRWGLFM